MGQEDDAHAAPLKRTEQERLTEAYAGYAADPARQAAWAADNPGNVRMRAEVERRLAAVAAEALAGGGAVLDAGCGTGYWLHRLAERGVAPERLHGCDLIAERVAAATARVPGATVAEADVRTLPYPDGAFALVLLFTVLTSQPAPDDHRASLREARRVAGPHGRVVVWDLRRGPRALPEALLREELGAGAHLETITLAPPLARRLGRLAPLYGALAAVRPLRTHWLAHR